MADVVVTLSLEIEQLKSKLKEVEAGLKKVPASKETKLTGDSKGLVKAIEDVQKQTVKLVGGVYAVSNIWRMFTGFMGDTYQEAVSAEQGLSKLEQVLNSTGGASGYSAVELQRLNSTIEDLTKRDADDITNAITVPLLTFTKIANENIPDAQMRIMDMVAVLGDPSNPDSFKNTALQVGKALNDPVNGLTALRRSGVSFTTEQVAVIKRLQETGQAAEAQRLILAELDKEFGGQAEKYATTYAGKIQGFTIAWNNLKEEIGMKLLPVLASAATGMIGLIKGIEGHDSALESEKNAIIGQRVEFERLVLIYNDLHNVQNRSAEQNALYSKTINELMTKYPNYLGKVDLERGKWGEIAGAISNARTQLQAYINMKIQEAVVKDMENQIVDLSRKVVDAQSALYTLNAEFAAGTKERMRMIQTAPNPLSSAPNMPGTTQTLSKWGMEELKLEKDIEALESRIEKLNSVMRQRLKISQEIYAVPPAPPVAAQGINVTDEVAGAYSGTGQSVVEKAKSDYQKLNEAMLGYISENETARLSAYGKELVQLEEKYQKELEIVNSAEASKEITASEAAEKRLQLEEIYANKSFEVQDKINAEIAADMAEREQQELKAQAEAKLKKLADEETYYNTMKYMDIGYAEWKISQYNKDVDAMAISEAQKVALKKKYLEEIETEIGSMNVKDTANKQDKADRDSLIDIVYFNRKKELIDQEIEALQVADEEKESIRKREYDALDRQREAYKTTYANILSSAQSIVSGLLTLNRQRKDDSIAKLEETAEREKWTNERLLAEKKKLNKQYEAEERKLKNVQKAMSIVQAIMNTAQGVTAALTLPPPLSFIMASVVGAMGAAQVAIMSAQKFAQGGLFRGKGGATEDANIIAISDGEYIVNAAATKRFKPVLDVINYGGNDTRAMVPKIAYAAGGQVNASMSYAGADLGAKLDKIEEDLQILNRNLVRKEITVNVQNSSDINTIVRKTDQVRAEMVRGGYVPVV